MASGGTLVGNAEFVETFCEVFYLVDACVQVVEFGIFVKTYRKGLHVAAVHAAICEVSFEGD